MYIIHSKITKGPLLPFGLLIFFLLCSLFILTKTIKSEDYVKTSLVTHVAPKCSNLFKDRLDISELRSAENYMPPFNETYTDNQIQREIKSDCNYFLQKQKYFLNQEKNDDEKSFRIAFSIIVFKSASQVERLLRTIYRPWNYYCIHVDLKSNKEFFEAITRLVKCLNSKYNNIVNTDNRVDVEWGQVSVLVADLNCMKELYERYKDWKYFINLTGQEFPLKTNAELVKILKAFKGANNLEGTYKRRNEDRVPTVKIPFPIMWFKGSVHITVNRDYVKFIFESPKSKVIFDALKSRSVPDEQFFATLNHNPQLRIPGSYVGDPDDNALPNEPLKNFMTRFKNWGEYSCISKNYVRGICIWGVGDLPKLVRAPHLFTNKLYEDFQPAALRCLEKWYYWKVKREIETETVAINESFYSTLPFVKYRFVPIRD